MIQPYISVNSHISKNPFALRLFLAIFLVLATARFTKGADLLTERYDNTRSGQNQSETILNYQNVNASTFGRLYTLATDGQVYAQPLYKAQVSIPNQGAHNVLYVATEHGSVYAFDADGNNPAQGYLWKVSFIDPASGVTPVLASDLGVGDISPEMTITGTPVIDPASNTMYVVAQTKEIAGGNTNFVFRLHALDITTGAEKMNGPAVITASVPGTGRGSVNGTLTMDNLFQNQRAGLALVNGVVYIPFGSHGDAGNFHGWVLGYNAANVQQQVGKFVTTPNGWGGGIWLGGGAISSDNAGNLYVGAGNGQFGDSHNQAGQENYADSLIRLSTNGGIKAADSFTPADQQSLENADDDMGTSDQLLLPDQPGVFPHLLVSADKTGTLYLVNRDGFGGFNASMNTDVQTIQTGNSLHNSLSYFNNMVYVGDDGAGVAAYKLQNGLLTGVPQSVTANVFGANRASRSGTSPVITANGTSNGILWAIDVHNGNAVLYAYDASNLANMLYNSNQAAGKRDVAGPAVKFTTPTAANGKVYVEGTSGITVYGLLSDVVQTTASPAFNPAPGKIFNNPQTVALSDTTPNATIFYTTDGSNPATDSRTYSSPIPINGPTTINAFAMAPTFNASPTVSAFYTVQSNTAPPVPTFSSGFSSAGLQLNGAVKIAASKLELTDGGADEVSSAFYTTPVNVQRFTTQFLFRLSNPSGEGFTFTLQNSALAALGSPAGGLGYGPDPNFHVSSYEQSISNSVAVKFDLANTSGEGVNSIGIYTNGASPTTPAINLANTGIDLHSGDTFMARLDYDGANLKLTLTDTNNAAKTFTTNFAIDIPGIIGSKTAYAGFTGSTGSGTATQDILQWNFNPLPAFSNGFTSFGLALNGTATIAGTRLQLTDGNNSEAGSAYYATPLNIQQFTTGFDFLLSNATADGFTFVIQRAGASALGSNGGGLGYAPSIGNSVAVKFDLFSNGGEGSNSTGLYVNGAFPTVPFVDLFSHGIDLHSGDPFHAQMSYDGKNLTLTITDIANSHTFTTVFPIDIPGTIGGTTAFVGFTGGAGGSSAIQEILKWNFSPGANSGPPPPPPPPAQPPVYNPGSGAVLNGTQSVALSDATLNATIYYTTDGSTPTTSSTKYAGPIGVSGATTIKAFATAPGDTPSAVVSASYTVQTGPGTPPSYGNGFTTAGLTFNGGASVVGTRLQLTDGGSNEARSAFYSTPVDIRQFTTDFQFQDKNAQGDGFTFTIQGQGPNAVGSRGGGLGYGPGIGKSVAVKFDLFSNGGEGTSSTGFYLNGASPTLPSVDMLSHGINIHNGDTFAAHLAYDGSNLTLTVTDTSNLTKTFTTAIAINIPGTVGGNTAYVGFTGGTGGATAIQQIVQWTYKSGSSPSPSGSGPSYGTGFTSAGLTLNGGASVAGTRLQLTDGGSNEATSAFYSTPVDIRQFTTDFQFQDTNAQGDGFTFTIQGQGPNAVGWNGGSLGYGPGIGNSVAVKFDLFSNAGEGTSSTGFYLNGAFPTVPSIDMLSHGIDIHNGDIFAVHLVYDGSNLTLTVTDTGNPAKTFTTATAVNIPATVGGNTAYVGFTGGAGGATAVQQIVQWTFGGASSPVTSSGPSFGNGFTSAGLTFNGGAAVAGTRLQLTDGGSNEATSSFYSTPVDIRHFTTDFQFQDTNAQGDGFTFTIQSQGANAVGWNGASLGYGPGIGNSVAVKFDLFSNGGEGTSSTGFYLNGAFPTVPSVDMLSHGIDIHNGDIFAVRLVYDGSNLTLTITDTNNPTKTFTTASAINIPATVGGNSAYVGFTGGTGGATAIQQIVQWTFSNQ